MADDVRWESANKRAAVILSSKRIWAEVSAISQLLIDEHEPDAQSFPTAMVLFAAHIMATTVNNANLVGNRRTEYLDAHARAFTAAYHELGKVLDGMPSKFLPVDLVKALQRSQTRH